MRHESEILIYQSPQGNTKVEVRVEGETVWLSQGQMAELFQTTKQNISLHIKNVFNEGELTEDSVVKEYLTTAADGKDYRTLYYNLDVIISVGYRVRSHVGTHFRIWATQRLREYIIKGFVLDDERLKQARDPYFDELLDRIRDIRSSEKVFYRKVCDIYATSIDYEPKSDMTKEFFATVQNKFHWAIHGHTAAELILQRADSSKPNMGLTNFPGEQIKKADVKVAKNYLNEGELKQLNLIVSQYLDFAELQAMNRKPMYMQDWSTKLHGFLTLNDREILDDAGTRSAKDAETHALQQFEQYRKALDAGQPDELDKAIKRLHGGKSNK
ncbi:virulence RhuM family protein [Flavitalea sp. BT771]|uniref:virulence RhuM family protein n=1 Tax=Flavitalea sp. BT771 TaxID=3063329 RepID=UPI0026E228D2|nr:virulence RhuM family protein [Flavitalea sp. BT771]MDO6435640.1 virulence RhuM family protein [Flavitalea sp. BT771]MDV6224541.1 virulence RhuM family protein [Flavitalea sp. BT771]